MNTKIKLRLIFVLVIGVMLLWLNSQQTAQAPSTTFRDWEKTARQFDADVVRIPAGKFVMGSDTNRSDERPAHSVYLDAFEIDRFEVTNAQYVRFVNDTGHMSPRYWSGSNYPASQADYPVVGISWDDADAYCTWVGKRLPTEAEWEKACRGTDARVYPWGDEWNPHRANVDVSVHIPHLGESELWQWNDAWVLLQATPTANALGLRRVGSFADGASPYGVMDLVGNASEWMADWYSWSDYANMPTQNPHGMSPPWNHNLRGSAWYDPQGAQGWAQNMSRCSARNSAHETSDPRVGFRCARTVP